MRNFTESNSPLDIKGLDGDKPEHPTLIIGIEITADGYQLRFRLPQGGKLLIESLELIPCPSHLRSRTV